MSLQSARSVLSSVADEQLSLPTAGRLAVAALVGAIGAGNDAPLAGQLLDMLLGIRLDRLASSQTCSATQHARLLWVQAAAAVALLQQLAATPAAGTEGHSRQGAAGAAVERLLLPALVSLDTHAAERQQALLAATAEAVAAFHRWGLAQQIVQGATESPVKQEAAADGYQPVQQLPGIQEVLGQLTAERRMGLATAVLQEALKAHAAQQAEQAPQAVLRYAAEHTLPAVLQMLATERPREAGGSKAKAQQQRAAAAAARSAAQQLLAAAVQAACAMQQRGSAMQQLWAACRELVGVPGHTRQLGLALLVQFCDALLQPAGASSPPCITATGGQPPWAGLRGDADFWRLLRECLADQELANRKQAAHLLQQALTGPDGQPPPAWRPLLKLLDCLEELAPHLVQDGWAEIDGLHPPASAAAGSAELMGTAPGGLGGSPCSWAWLEVVWSRGLSHQHLQVQRQVLSSFLGRDWQVPEQQERQPGTAGSVHLTDVPQGFVLLTMLPAAGQAHMWRGQGASELQQQLASWVGRYAGAQARASPQQAQQLLLGLLARLESGAGSGQQQRPLVQTLAAALLAAAEAVAAAAAPGGEAAWQLVFLQRLSRATSRLSAHWGSSNSSHARSTCRSLLGAAAATVALLPAERGAQDAGESGGGTSSVQLLAAVAAWLQELPLDLLLPDGELHPLAAAWVGAGGWQHTLPLLAGSMQAFMAGQALAPDQPTNETSSSALQPPDGWADCQRQAAGRACLAMLLAAGAGAGRAGAVEAATAAQPSTAELAAALRSWSEVLMVLYCRPYLSNGSAERCLLLLSALLSVCAPSPAAAAKPQLPASGQQLEVQQAGQLAETLSSALAAAADELASYAGMSAAATLWAQQSSQAQPEGLPVSATPGEASKRAQLALSCLCRSVQLLACQPGTLACAGPVPAGHRLAAGCLEALHSFGVVQQGQQQVAATGWGVAQWQQAAARLLPMADCCAALSTAAEAGWLEGPSLAAAASAAATALDAVLQLQESALEAAAGAHAQGKAATASGTAGALAAYAHRLCWRTTHGLVLLLQRLRREQPAREQPQSWREQQAAVLAAVLTSMQRSAQLPAIASDARDLLFQLRCCRLALAAWLANEEVARLVLAQRRQHEQQPHHLQQQADASGSSTDVELAAWLCQAAWEVYEGAAAATKRRRAGLTAAVVSACLHPELFQPRTASPALHAAEGPLQRVLGRLLELGAKSWRIMSITSLQLFGLLSRHPELAPHYLGSLQQALLWGASEDPGQSGVGDPVDADSAAELAALVAPADAELAAAFAGSELAPRCAALCLLRCWVEQSERTTQQGAAPQQGSAGAAAAGPAGAAREAGELVWRRLLGLAAADPELSAARYSPLGHVHRKKVRLWQALCTLSPLVPEEQVEADFDALLVALDKPELSTVRQYIDTAALVLLRRRPALLRSRVLPALRDCSTSGAHTLSSLLIIAARELVRRLQPAGVGLPGRSGGGDGSAVTGTRGNSGGQLAAPPAEQLRLMQGPALDGETDMVLLGEVLGAIVPWALSHVHALRTFSQLLLWRLYELFPSVPATDATAAALLRFLSENDDVGRLRRGLSHTFLFDSFDVDTAVTPAGMLCMGTSVLRVDASFEGAPRPLMEAVQSFLSSERQSLRQDLRESKASAMAAELAPAAHVGQLPPAAAGGGSNWQKKGGGAGASAGTAGAAVGGVHPSPAAAGPWAEALGSAALLGGGLDGMEAELAAAAEAAAAARGGPRQHLVVVASLLTKAPNLAGLARTCEVFRASRLVLGDLSVTRRQEFTSIAVTAHQWIPLTEVPETALAAWLQAQAAAGWTLVGLEQTAESVQLQDFSFPERTVLVLGREKEGIPPHILGLLHCSVEIPQLGLIRSLNVHVSGAICMWELTRQRLVGGSAAGRTAGTTASPALSAAAP